MALTKEDLAAIQGLIEKSTDSLVVHVENRFKEVDSRFDAMDRKIESTKDQIIRSVQLVEEDIRQHCAHVDELAETNRRLDELEKKVA